MRYRLYFGPLAGGILLLAIVGLAPIVPGYSQIRQTVSEIGEQGSPAAIPFTLMMCGVAACLVVFATGVRAVALAQRRSASAAYLIIATAISTAGVGVFAFPHPLHNVFGMSEIVGYQAPLFMALNWRGDPRARSLVRFSWIMFTLVWVALIANVSVLDRSGVSWSTIHPVYGVIQRTLFATWFLWCAGAGALLPSLTNPRQAVG